MAAPACVGGRPWDTGHPGRSAPAALRVTRLRVKEDLAPRQRLPDPSVPGPGDERVVEVQLAEPPERPQPGDGGVADARAVEAERPQVRQAAEGVEALVADGRVA